MTKDAPGMRGTRSRNENGQHWQRRGDTHVGTIERLYGIDLGARSDMHLNTLLQREGVQLLHELVESGKGRK